MPASVLRLLRSLVRWLLSSSCWHDQTSSVIERYRGTRALSKAQSDRPACAKRKTGDQVGKLAGIPLATMGGTACRPAPGGVAVAAATALG